MASTTKPWNGQAVKRALLALSGAVVVALVGLSATWRCRVSHGADGSWGLWSWGWQDGVEGSKASQIHAVLVAGSAGWGNYRHQVRALRAPTRVGFKASVL
jgi:hypothetical protein